MVFLTADDVANLAKTIAQFDRMGGRFSGRIDFETSGGDTIPVFYRFDGTAGRHVMVFNPNVEQ